MPRNGRRGFQIRCPFARLFNEVDDEEFVNAKKALTIQVLLQYSRGIMNEGNDSHADAFNRVL